MKTNMRNFARMSAVVGLITGCAGPIQNTVGDTNKAIQGTLTSTGVQNSNPITSVTLQSFPPAIPVSESTKSRFPDRVPFHSSNPSIDPITESSNGRIVRTLSPMSSIPSLSSIEVVDACNGIQGRPLEAIAPGQPRCSESCHNTDTLDHNSFMNRMREIESRVPADARLDHTNIQHILEKHLGQEGKEEFLVHMRRGDLYLYADNNGMLVCEARRENGEILQFTEENAPSKNEMILRMREYLTEQDNSVLPGVRSNNGVIITGSPNRGQRKKMEQQLLGV